MSDGRPIAAMEVSSLTLFMHLPGDIMVELDTVSFADRAELRTWLAANHRSSPGVWVRIYKASAKRDSISFTEILDEGLCFGWSESQRRAGDQHSYLQKFTPRRSAGTLSERNKAHAKALIAEGRMTAAGLEALGW